MFFGFEDPNERRLKHKDRILEGSAGFDAVVGNPPYVRQESLKGLKDYFSSVYAVFSSTIDLYVYFFEKALCVVRRGGRFSFIVTNKWLKASYGETLRRLLTEEAWPQAVVDFGHAKQIFEEADVFPSIVVACRPLPPKAPPQPFVCSISRDRLRLSDLSHQIESEGFQIDLSRLGRVLGNWNRRL